MQSDHLTIEELSAFIDGQLGDDERARVDAHLQECTDCRRELSDLERTVLAVRELSPVPLPRSFRVAAAPARPAGWSLLGWFQGWLQPPLLRAAGGLAAALMVAIVAVDALQPARILEVPLGAPMAGLQGAEAPAGQERAREALGESPAGAPLRAEPAADASRPASTEDPQAGVAPTSTPGESAGEPPPRQPLRAAKAQERAAAEWVTPGRLAAVALGFVAAALLAGSFLVPRRR